MNSMPRPGYSSAPARAWRHSRRGSPYWKEMTPRGAPAPGRTRAPEPIGALLRHRHHVIDGLLHQVVWHVGAATLGGHHAALALEPVERVLVKGRLAFGNARCPRSLVTGLRCPGNTLTMAGT